MKNNVLTISEVASKVRRSKSCINRWLGLSRRGQHTFPLPLNEGTGGAGLWLESTIDAWLESQAIASTPIPTTAKPRRRNAAAAQVRQAATERALAKYRTK